VNEIGSEGGIKLAEALKSNTSLTALSLSSNMLMILIIHSHSTKIIRLALKQESN
jgi:hypothetical protein